MSDDKVIHLAGRRAGKTSEMEKIAQDLEARGLKVQRVDLSTREARLAVHEAHIQERLPRLLAEKKK